MKTIYYAHSMSIYGSDQEARDIILLEELGFKVVNPADYAEEYETWKENWHTISGYDPMEFWTDMASNCDWLAFRAHPDGSIPAGVSKEIQHFWRYHIGRVIELPCGIIRRSLEVEETREYLRESGQR